MTKADAELRELDRRELVERLDEAKQELFNLRFQLATGQLDNTTEITHGARARSRACTRCMREREIAGRTRQIGRRN